MPRRLQPTLIDYLVIAINPALIMVLVGSLVYFLLEMFYQGEYPERLHFCLTLFIIGAVLIARISMEEGWERAAPFGIALAVVILMAMFKFVSYKDTQLAAIGWLINCGLIALASWCAYKLTWDCTLMDETQDASGEGLLQTVGLDSPKPEAATDRGRSPSSPSPLTGEGRGEGAAEKKGTVRLAPPANARAESMPPPDPKSKPGKSRWQRFLERRRRPHAPGVWVVYFSLAALPLFGLGQAFIPVTKTASRQYAFVLLCIYVACGLGLLLTTSFLGLRRYLRQRRLEMPVTMVGTWLVTGAVLIVSLLLLTALLPRPNAEYTISQLPSALTSEQHDSSQITVGKEGVKDEDAKSAPGERNRPEEKDSQSNDNPNQNGTEQSSKPQGGGSKSGKSQSDSSKSEDAKPGDSKPSESKPSESKPGESKSGESKSGESKSGESKPGDSKSAESKPSESKSDQAKPSEPKPDERKPDKSAGGPGKAPSPKPWEPPGTPPKPNLPLAGRMVADLLKWVFYGALAGLLLWWLIFHWRVLLDWLQALLNGWRDLWGLLFGRRQAAHDAAASAPRHKSFADYSDPFAAGVAGRYSPVELVRYSFEALEAWARDNGWPREPDQTVHEFARQLAVQVEDLAAPARALAELYSWAAYSPRTLPASSIDPVREFWQALLRVERSRELVSG